MLSESRIVIFENAPTRSEVLERLIQIPFHRPPSFGPMSVSRIVDADMQFIEMPVEAEVLQELDGRFQCQHLPLELKRHAKNFGKEGLGELGDGELVHGNGVRRIEHIWIVRIGLCKYGIERESYFDE